jgi:hypothetical protein
MGLDLMNAQPETRHICGKCGRPATATEASAQGWLIEQRLGKPEGWLIIRCAEHITNYALRTAGLKQDPKLYRRKE